MGGPAQPYVQGWEGGTRVLTRVHPNGMPPYPEEKHRALMVVPVTYEEHPCPRLGKSALSTHTHTHTHDGPARDGVSNRWPSIMLFMGKQLHQ